jgi:hypothetical protein
MFWRNLKMVIVDSFNMLGRRSILWSVNTKSWRQTATLKVLLSLEKGRCNISLSPSLYWCFFAPGFGVLTHRIAMSVQWLPMGWMTGIQFLPAVGNFLLVSIFRLALGPTHPLIQWIKEDHYPGVKWSKHEIKHSPSSRAKVKNICSYTSTSHTSLLHVQLSKGTLISLFMKQHHCHPSKWFSQLVGL